MKCRSCHRVASRGGRGYCKAHYDQKLRLERPVSKWVDPGPAREHIARLHSEGMPYRRIGELVGMSAGALSRVANGQTKFIQLHNEQLILGISVSGEASPRPESWVPVFASARRLRSLSRMGYSQSVLAERLGVRVDTVNKYLKLHGPMMRSSIADAVTELFAELQLTPLDSPEFQTLGAKKARTLAAKRGWPLPLEWDEDTLNDPTAMPHAKVCIWPSTRRLRALCRMGFSQKYLSERLDIPTDKTSEILRFLGPIDYSLADAIEKLFNELRDTPSDDERLTSRRAAQARSVTASYGWAFPGELGDVFKKPAKQELESMNRSKNDRANTAKQMLSEGVSKAEIARRMSVNPTTVYFWLREAA